MSVCHGALEMDQVIESTGDVRISVVRHLRRYTVVRHYVNHGLAYKEGRHSILRTIKIKMHQTFHIGM